MRMYGSYSDEDLSEWERLPQNIQVLTSSAFGAWLLRRDKRIKDQEPKTNAFNKIKTEIQNLTVVYPFVNHIDQYVKKDDVIKIIDKYRQEG